MKTLRVKFPNAAGDLLSARLELPLDAEPYAYALFAHCFTCTKNLKAVRHLSHALTGRGIAVLRFDFTGLGESEGDFTDTNFTSNVGDLVAAARWLEEEYEAPALLV
ncbi:MAG: CocE/NonD family hydrolase, partial [Catalinimonas sp.]